MAELRNGSALLTGDDWSLWGRSRPSTRTGAASTGMVRLERVRLAQGPGENRIQPELTTSMFLGSHWEHVFRLGAITLRAHAAGSLERGRHWLEIAPGDLWVF